MRPLLYLSFALVLLGCSSTASTREGGDGSLRSRPITLSVPHHATANPLSAPPSVLVTARAICEEGAGCSGFFVDFRNPGGSDLFLNYTPVTAEVDGEQFSWPDIVLNEQRVAIATGTFLQLGFEASRFRKVAFAQEVIFHLGSNPFHLSYEQRAPFRQLLDAVQ